MKESITQAMAPELTTEEDKKIIAAAIDGGRLQTVATFFRFMNACTDQFHFNILELVLEVIVAPSIDGTTMLGDLRRIVDEKKEALVR